MDLEIEEMFGDRREPVANDSDNGSGSEAEEEDDGGRNNPMEEALEVPDPERGAGPTQEAAKAVKPKRVIKNPVPKLDLTRIAGPRGILSFHKSIKNAKFKGKGYEVEDLDVLMKYLEHWAHRLYPRYPFHNVLEQIEKLGFKKNVKVMMKRYRMDMFDETPVDDNVEDTVQRDCYEEENPEPVVDVFDELLGDTFPSSNQSAPVPTVHKPSVLTPEQRERIERNKRLAAERRQAKLREQQNQQDMDDTFGTNDLGQSFIPDDSGATRDLAGDTLERMEVDDTTNFPNEEDGNVNPPMNNKETADLGEERVSENVNAPGNKEPVGDGVEEKCDEPVGDGVEEACDQLTTPLSDKVNNDLNRVDGDDLGGKENESKSDDGKLNNISTIEADDNEKEKLISAEDILDMLEDE